MLSTGISMTIGMGGMVTEHGKLKFNNPIHCLIESQIQQYIVGVFGLAQ